MDPWFFPLIAHVAVHLALTVTGVVWPPKASFDWSRQPVIEAKPDVPAVWIV
jgi:hypothetical protein